MPRSKSDPQTGAEPPVWTPSDAVADPETAAGNAAAETSGSAAAAPPRRSGAVAALLAIIALAATAGIGFAAGRATVPADVADGPYGAGGNRPNHVAADASFRPDQPGLFGDRDGLGIRGGFGAVTGTVTAITADSITLKLPGGRIVTISTSSATTYHTRRVATSSDVSTGDTVTVVVAGGGGLGPNAGAGVKAQTATDVTVTSN